MIDQNIMVLNAINQSLNNIPFRYSDLNDSAF